MFHRIQNLDPRYYQITILSLLLFYGFFILHFDLTFFQILISLSTVLFTQFLFSKILKMNFDFKSPLISGLSLCLLLRSNEMLFIFLGGLLAIASKFIIKDQGKHFLNPTNFGIVLMILCTEKVWVSPGQWGNVAFFAFFMACLGGLVINRAARSDVTYAFILFYLCFLFGRSFYLGEPLSIPLHRLESGALLLFTFFMISDPRATPNARKGRILFSFLVAALAWYIQFRLFRTNALLWSLFLCSFLIPFIDRLFVGKPYQWKGNAHEKNTASLELSQFQPSHL
ncbi:MAG: RnfABCDGE type electron transport complex subunit D [Deltaproteobacteria bacterium]|nr:RnfABCDGE type electron transport complex subunit D [Deltaproteobacteria bacterium]